MRGRAWLAGLCRNVKSNSMLLRKRGHDTIQQPAGHCDLEKRGGRDFVFDSRWKDDRRPPDRTRPCV